MNSLPQGARWRFAFPIAAFAMALTLVQAPARQNQRQETLQDYYRKWLEEDVTYIIDEEEKSIFASLRTPEEKDQFIEQFWVRRDPTPLTAENQFKTEHYRRIAFVNERYFSGVPGWRTDRGMVYIRFGPPDSVERQPYGGPYRRRKSEGGGETTVFPFERWWYARIPGIGDDIEIEFVDRNFTNEYRISTNSNDKDAFLFTPGHGNTQGEIDGTVSRFDRLSAPLGIVNRSRNPALRRADLPFEKLRRWATIQKAPQISNAHLQEIVTTDVRFDQLPFLYKADWLNAGEKALVPLTVSVRRDDLQFKREESGEVARVNIFGMVKNLQGRISALFEDEMVVRKSADEPGSHLYQKILLLDPGRYRLDLVLEDTGSGNIGTLKTGLTIPRLEPHKIAASPVVFVERAEPIADQVDLSRPPEMFTLGTLKVVPRMSDVLPPLKHLLFYFQLYNAGIDATTRRPHLALTYQLVDQGRVVAEKSDPEGSRIHFASDERIVLLEYLSFKKVRSQSPVLRISVKDRVTGQTLAIEEPLRLAKAPPAPGS